MLGQWSKGAKAEAERPLETEALKFTQPHFGQILLSQTSLESKGWRNGLHLWLGHSAQPRCKGASVPGWEDVWPLNHLPQNLPCLSLCFNLTGGFMFLLRRY